MVKISRSKWDLFNRILPRYIITDLQYNSQNAEVPMGPKQPGPIVLTFPIRRHFALTSDLPSVDEEQSLVTSLQKQGMQPSGLSSFKKKLPPTHSVHRGPVTWGYARERGRRGRGYGERWRGWNREWIDNSKRETLRLRFGKVERISNVMRKRNMSEANGWGKQSFWNAYEGKRERKPR